MVLELSASLRKPSRTRATMRRGPKSMWMDSGQEPEQAPHWRQENKPSQPGRSLTWRAHPGSASRCSFNLRSMIGGWAFLGSLLIAALGMGDFPDQAALLQIDSALQTDLFGVAAVGHDSFGQMLQVFGRPADFVRIQAAGNLREPLPSVTL